MQAAVAELRGERRPAALTPFPLDSVMRIHDELRESGQGTTKLPSGEEGHREPQQVSKTVASLPEATALSERMESLERAVTTGNQEARENANRTERMRRTWQIVLLVTVLTLSAAVVAGLVLQRRVEARLNDASARVAAAERQAAIAADLADKRIASTREDAEHRIQEARQSAQSAQVISGVLAAPDLIRFNLMGQAGAPRAFAQVLWSRSRGLVLSGDGAD